MPGEKGTIGYWQRTLAGKSKSDIKQALGTPTGIAEKGAVYQYAESFFHPDLDVWRALIIRFAENDLVESFTGEGDDTRTYQLGSTSRQEVVDTASTPSPVAGPSPSPTPNLDELKEKVQTSLVTIEMTEPYPGFGDSGLGGTGFVVEREDGKFVTTNLHVLDGEASTEIQLAWHHGPRLETANGQRDPAQSRIKSSFEEFQKDMAKLPLPAIKSISGERLLPATGLLLSQTRDIGLLPVSTEVQALRFSSMPPRRGATVIILGNPEAGHTIAALEAEVTNVGPDRFELDRVSGGDIVPGMSGSPVVHVESGEVIGIITYAVERKKWVGDEVHSSAWGAQVMPTFEISKRFFAYRCDNLSDLAPFTWPQFVNDCLVLEALKQRTRNVFWAKNAYVAAIDSKELVQLFPDFDHKTQITYSSFVSDAQRFLASSDLDMRIGRWREYQRRLETLLVNDLEDQKPPRERNPLRQMVTPYYRRELSTTLAAARRGVTTALRSEAGKIQADEIP